MDWRNIKNGYEIPSQNYCDQPYIIKTEDGAWLCAMTTGSGDEGTPGQHIEVLKSYDRGETWKPAGRMEPEGAPENSYSVLLKTDFGRIYCFYNFNSENIRQIKADNPPYENGTCTRVDSLGAYVYRYSDDNGNSWSEKRGVVPVRKFRIDMENPYNGEIMFFWNVGRPFVHKGSAYLSIHKVGRIGEGFFAKSEGVLVKSENIMNERDIGKIRFETLPEGMEGIKGPEGGGPVSEEHSYTVLEDGTFFTVFRTTDGRPAFSYSRDGGRSWKKSKYMPVKHPRAANFIWKTGKGRYLYWFHNHGGRGYRGRNPAWCLGAVEEKTEEGNRLVWSQPEVFLYDDNPSTRISYPDLVCEDGVFHISETQKTIARTHAVDSVFMEKLFNEKEKKGIVCDGLVYDSGVKKPGFPAKFVAGMQSFGNHCDKNADNPEGLTLELVLEEDSSDRTVLFDSTARDGTGMLLERNGGKILFSMSDGIKKASFESDESLNGEKTDHVAVVIDKGLGIVYFIINGIFNDGGGNRERGWGRYDPGIGDVIGRSNFHVDGSISAFKVYKRPLMTVEICRNMTSLKKGERRV